MSVAVRNLPHKTFVQQLERFHACTPAWAAVIEHEFDARQTWDYALKHRKNNWLRWGLSIILNYSHHLSDDELDWLAGVMDEIEEQREKRWRWLDNAIESLQNREQSIVSILIDCDQFQRTANRIERMYGNALYQLISWKEN